MEPASTKIDPNHFWAMQARLDDDIRAAAPGIPLLAMQSGPDPAMTGNWSWEDGQLAAAGILHGDPTSGNPYVHILVTTGEPHSLVNMQRLAGYPPPSVDHPIRMMPDDLGPLSADGPTITIEGESVDTESVFENSRLFQVARPGKFSVVVESRGVDPTAIDLVRISDIEPFLQARRQYLRAARNEN